MKLFNIKKVLLNFFIIILSIWAIVATIWIIYQNEQYDNLAISSSDKYDGLLTAPSAKKQELIKRKENELDEKITTYNNYIQQSKDTINNYNKLSEKITHEAKLKDNNIKELNSQLSQLQEIIEIKNNDLVKTTTNTGDTIIDTDIQNIVQIYYLPHEQSEDIKNNIRTQNMTTNAVKSSLYQMYFNNHIEKDDMTNGKTWYHNKCEKIHLIFVDGSNGSVAFQTTINF